MNKSKILTLIFLCLLITGSGKMDIMNIDEFYYYLKDRGLDTKTFLIKVDGEENAAYHSKEKFVYFEEVIFFGTPDIKATYYNPIHTENTFYLLYNNIKIKVNYRDIRTYLTESYEKIFTSANLNNTRNDIKELLTNETEKVMVCEYGLKKGVKYHALFNIEYYNVPGKEDDIEERKNIVLWISDKSFKNGKPQEDITPLYKGWSY